MKKVNLIKITAVVSLALMSVFSKAQVISSLPTYDVKLPADTSSLKDTVSVGSIMPYWVGTDPIIRNSSFFNASGFLWTVTNSTLNTSALTATSAAGASTTTTSLTTLSIGGTGTYYSDTLVYVTFPSTTGSSKVSTLERSVPKYSATAGCDGSQRDLDVNVIALPTVPTIADADTAQGGCSAATSYTLNFNFSSSTVKFPLYLGFTLSYHNINNVASGTPKTYYYKITSASDKIILASTYLDAVSGGSSLEGRYTVALGNLWDRISIRAINGNAIATDASALKASIYIYPTPSTQRIKHIKTL
jgi:hypothetical protein